MQDSDFFGLVTWFPAPFTFPRLHPLAVPPGQALDNVLDSAGASLFRDAVDARVVAQVRSQTGGVIDSQDEVGGWPAAPARYRDADYDRDRDGMADWWERLNGLDPEDSSDHSRYDLHTGYTNLEMFLNRPQPSQPWPGPEPPGC